MSEPTAVLIDTGPLVALVDNSDQAHLNCLAALTKLSPRTSLLTVSPALTEAFYLLSRIKGGQAKLFALVKALQIDLMPFEAKHLRRCESLMEKYEDLPMDFADAVMVTIAEEMNISVIFTLDKRGFRIYRPEHIKNLTLLP